MNSTLRRALQVFVIVGLFALVADITLRLLVQKNRSERAHYYETYIRPAETKTQESSLKQDEYLKGRLSGEIGADTPLPSVDWGDPEISQRMFTLYDEPLFHLLLWRRVADGLVLGSSLMAMLCYAMRQSIVAREKMKRPNQSSQPTRLAPRG
jgi:hypothetical protein